MQKDSRELEELFTVTALMSDPVLACDEWGQMVYANLAAMTLFGEIDMDQNSMDDCPEVLGIFDGQGERMLEPQELPLAQAAYEGKVVQVNLMVRQDEAASPVEATAFPVLNRLGRQIGAMMVCRCLGAFPEPARVAHLA
jgi:transcriptional regulator of aromatic amino acid metabolism